MNIRYVIGPGDYDKWRVYDTTTKEKVAHFPSREEAQEYANSLNRRENFEIEKVEIKANPNVDLSGWTIEYKQETANYIGYNLYRLMTPWYRRLWDNFIWLTSWMIRP